MEEDVALANIALDQLGAARLLLTYAGELEGAGRDEDDAGLPARRPRVPQLPAGRAAQRRLRGTRWSELLFLSAYQLLLYDRAAPAGADERLAGDRGQGAQGVRVPPRPRAQWTVRLGDGTDESHRRMQDAVDELWPYTHELFTDAAAPFEPLRAAWLATVEPVLAEATLTRPADGWAPDGGRRGVHTEHLSYLLAEMQVLHRAHPGATMVTAVETAVAAVVDPELRVRHHRRARHPARGRGRRRRPGHRHDHARPTPAARRWT